MTHVLAVAVKNIKTAMAEDYKNNSYYVHGKKGVLKDVFFCTCIWTIIR